MNTQLFSIISRRLLLLLPFLAPALSSAATPCASAPQTLATRSADAVQNHCPQAKAGDVSLVLSGEAIALDASGSTDADGDPLTYRWQLMETPLGSGAAITDALSAKTHFTPDLDGDYTLLLTITDAKGAQSTDTLRLSTHLAAPVAHAGADQTAAAGTSVNLDGISSYDFNDAPLAYAWQLVEQPLGSQATLDSADQSATGLKLDAPGDYVVALTVDNGRSASAIDYVRISTRNSRPVAHAGRARTLAPGSTLILDGTRSADIDKQPLSYEWSVLSQPADSDVSLDSRAKASPSAYLTAEGLYVFQLIVHDGELLSEATTVAVEVDNRRLQNVNPDDYKHLTRRGGGDDEDGDGVPDPDDNCVLASNASQIDSDGDGIGNACDPDLNNDGVVNFIDLGILRTVFFTNDPDADFNGDGIVNFIDLGILRSRFFLPPGPAGTIIWVSLVDGDFQNRLNWQPQIVPTAGALALIDVAPAVTVTAQSDNITVKGLVNNETLDFSSSTFTATDALENGGQLDVRSTTINDTQIIGSEAGNGSLTVFTNSNWRNVTLGIDSLIVNGANINVTDSMTIDALLEINAPTSPTGIVSLNNSTLGGTGTIFFNAAGNPVITEARVFNGNSTTLTVDAGLTIRGGNGTVGNAAATLIFNASAQADTANTTLRIVANQMSGGGSAIASNGGTIEIDAILDNAGATFNLDGADGNLVFLSTAEARNGTLQMTPGSTLAMQSGSVAFRNMLINGDLFIPNGVTVNVSDGLTLNGVASILSTDSPTGFVFQNDVTLDGNATIMIDGTANSVISEPRLLPANTTTLTIGPNVNIQGGKGTIGNAAANLIFQGTLTADIENEELSIGGANWSANNAMTAINGGGLRFFGGMNNAGQTLAIDAADGEFNITGATQINDAVIDATAGSTMISALGTSTLTASTLNIDVEIRNGSNLNVSSGLTFNGSMDIIAPTSPTGLIFNNTQTLDGSGTITFVAAGNTVQTEARLLPANTTTLTVGPSITVRGGNGTIGNPAAGLVFNGTVVADVAGSRINIGGSLWSASQALRGTGGGELELFGTLDNDGIAVTVDNATGPTRVRGSTTLREATINGTPGTQLEFFSTTTLDAMVINADLLHNNAANSNVFNGLTLNGTATINAPVSPTGLIFNNSQLFSGNATVVLNLETNTVISEARLLPANTTTLSFGPNVRVEGAGTVGNLAALMNLGDATFDANSTGQRLRVNASDWSSTGVLRASNGGTIEMGGNHRNANASFTLDASGGSAAMVSSATFNDTVINATAGTVIDGASGTFDNVAYTGDIVLSNGENINVRDGLTLNGTLTIDAPSSPTGLVFLNTQILGGNANVVFERQGNPVISEPRLLPANTTELTIASTVTIRGSGTVGNAAATVNLEGSMIADDGALILSRPAATISGTLEAGAGNTLTINAFTSTTASGALIARENGELAFTGNLSMTPSTITTLDVDATGNGRISAADVSHDGTLNMSAVNGFAPALGSVFDITGSQGSGAFSTVNSAGLGGGQVFDVTYDVDGQALATVN